MSAFFPVLNGSNTCLCRFSEAFITSKHLVEGLIVERTAQAQHGIAIDHIPPRARAFHAHVANEFVGRFNAARAPWILPAFKRPIVDTMGVGLQIPKQIAD